MANIKISELEEYTQVEDDDLFVVVDVNNEETKKVKATNIGTGGKEIIMVGDESVATKNTKLLIEKDNINSLGTEVVNSLDGNETNMSPSVKVVNDIISYSTEEHFVGYWINNKPVYEKTIVYTHDGTIGKLNEMITIDIPHGISNFGHVVEDVKGFSSTGNLLPLLNGTSSTSQSVNIAFVNSANIQMRIINVQITARTWYLTLRYTKTTD